MIKIKFISIICLLVTTSVTNAQNTLWLTNGKKIPIKEFKLDNKDLVIYQNKKGKFKSIERFDVFSIIEASKNEIVIYQPDSSYKDAFNLLEMRAFVQGEYDAYQKFKSPLTTVGGIVVAGGSSVVINPVYVIVISGVYCGVIGATKTSKKKIFSLVIKTLFLLTDLL